MNQNKKAKDELKKAYRPCGHEPRFIWHPGLVVTADLKPRKTLAPGERPIEINVFAGMVKP